MPLLPTTTTTDLTEHDSTSTQVTAGLALGSLVTVTQNNGYRLTWEEWVSWKVSPPRDDERRISGCLDTHCPTAILDCALERTHHMADSRLITLTFPVCVNLNLAPSLEACVLLEGTPIISVQEDGESGWRTGYHPRLPPLRLWFDPGLVRGLWLVDLNLTPRFFLWVLRFSSLGKNQLSRQNLCRLAYWSRASGSGNWITTPNAATLALFWKKNFLEFGSRFRLRNFSRAFHIVTIAAKSIFVSNTLFQVFRGNYDIYTTIAHKILPSMKARFIRINPKAWRSYIAMRVELYGCRTRGEKSNDSCMK